MKRSELIKDVSQKLRGLSQTGPLVVGVDGPDCSGKTMFSGEIENALVGEGRKVLVLHVDDFCYFPGSKPVKGNPVSLAEDFLYNTINFMKISEESDDNKLEFFLKINSSN